MDNLTDFDKLPRSTFVDLLAVRRNEHLDLLKRCTSKETVPANPLNHLVVAALRRSAALIEGFLVLIDMKNKFCAVSLIRMQLDSAMRVHACSLVGDPVSFLKHILDGGKLTRFNQSPKLDLADVELHRRLTAKYPYTSDLYNDTNGYVHLSNHHLFGILDWDGLKNENIELTDPDSLPPWPEEDLKGWLVQMMWASHVLTEECKKLIVHTTEEPSG